MTIEVVTTRTSLREALGNERPGFVATMGALHEGHQALIARSAQENARTVVSIFVNPAQFGNAVDLQRYPRDPEKDAHAAASAGASLIFAPTVAEIYPCGFDSWIDVGELSQRWEGSARPGHFRGVATVVAILLNLVRPARAYFGEKDYQQLQVIRRVHRDLALPCEIVGADTVRANDGLALSSRNARLSDEERALARSIPRAIDAIQDAAASGEQSIQKLIAAGRALLDQPGVTLDYLAIVDPADLSPLPHLDRAARVLVAAEIGGVRLIDNAPIVPPAASAVQP